MKRLFILMVILGLTTYLMAAPDNTVSVPNSFSANTTADPSQVNANFNEVQTKFNAHDHEDITETGVITSGTWQGSVIDSDYGGTGKDLSTATQGSILFLSNTGVVSQLTPSTAGNILQTNGNAADPSWVAGGSAREDIIYGMEVQNYASQQTTIVVSPGVVYWGNTQYRFTTPTTLTFGTDNDWWQSKQWSYTNKSSWCYVGLSSVGTIKLLGSRPPNRHDAFGYKAKPHLYFASEHTGTAAAPSYWRVLGFVGVLNNVSATPAIQKGDKVYFSRGVKVGSVGGAGTYRRVWTNVPKICDSGEIVVTRYTDSGAVCLRNSYENGSNTRRTPSLAGGVQCTNDREANLGWWPLNPIATGRDITTLDFLVYNSQVGYATVQSVELNIR